MRSMTIRFSMLPHQVPLGPKNVFAPFHDHSYPLSFSHNFCPPQAISAVLSCKKSCLGSTPAAPIFQNAIGCTSQLLKQSPYLYGGRLAYQASQYPSSSCIFLGHVLQNPSELRRQRSTTCISTGFRGFFVIRGTATRHRRRDR